LLRPIFCLELFWAIFPFLGVNPAQVTISHR
jgi:hypothetical protein